jgi:hypothetical protein
MVEMLDEHDRNAEEEERINAERKAREDADDARREVFLLISPKNKIGHCH